MVARSPKASTAQACPSSWPSTETAKIRTQTTKMAMRRTQLSLKGPLPYARKASVNQKAGWTIKTNREGISGIGLMALAEDNNR